MNNKMNNANKTEKHKLVFKPAFIFSVKKSEKFLSSMEQQGWALYKVRFGCLLYFAPCKPREDTVYYLTQFTKWKFNEVAKTYGIKALNQAFSERELKKNDFVSFTVDGIGYSKMFFNIYRFKNNLETVIACKKKRSKDGLSYITDILRYICANVLAPAILIWRFVHWLNG